MNHVKPHNLKSTVLMNELRTAFHIRTFADVSTAEYVKFTMQNIFLKV